MKRKQDVVSYCYIDITSHSELFHRSIFRTYVTQTMVLAIVAMNEIQGGESDCSLD
jgi:hypothetical protein